MTTEYLKGAEPLFINGTRTGCLHRRKNSNGRVSPSTMLGTVNQKGTILSVILRKKRFHSPALPSESGTYASESSSDDALPPIG